MAVPAPTFEPLSVLVGRELAAVTFVRDYFQFAFDGPGLTASGNSY